MKTLIKNIFISILWVTLLLVAFTVYEIGLPNSLSDARGDLDIFIIFFGFYLSLSLIGWIFFGLPTHWVITKWTSKEWFYYPVAGFGFFLLVLMFNNIELALLLGGAAILQASVFAYLIGRDKLL